MIQRMRIITLQGLAICTMIHSGMGANFYVDSKDGDDSRNGRTPVNAWRALNQANRAELKPGDRLLLRGGRTFEGSLQLGPEDSGAPAKPVIIGSYGAGRATIQAGTGYGILDCVGGLVDKCVAWKNGKLCNYASGGPCGIWTAIARRVIIQECESYSNRTSGVDRDGFGLDGGCISCVLQYNYSKRS